MPKLEMQVISPRIQTKQNTKHKKKKTNKKDRNNDLKNVC